MKARQLEKLGIPAILAKPAKWAAQEARRSGLELNEVKRRLAQVVEDPESMRDDPFLGQLAVEVSRHQRADARRQEQAALPPRTSPAPHRQWGEDLDPQSVKQIETACWLPISAQAALMPDAHLGYGLPIGGVLATRGAVIPYAVGVDIACRVKLSVLDLPPKLLESEPDRLINALERETSFGVGATFDKKQRREHPVLDADWSVSPITQQNKDKAAQQLGTSGSGNHFVEFGLLTVGDRASSDVMQLPDPGTYLALLSHSGSRGTGAAVCDYYSRLAMQLHPELDKQQRHLAWLDLQTHEGQEYWAAMNLMGQYAAANHACIHDAIARHLGARVIAGVENHHNFAWTETHVDPETGDETELIVHRKGATPASAGVLGMIPGSMASPGYVVRGKGEPASLNSAAHGAGRVMSRRAAKQHFRWSHVKPVLENAQVTLLSAGLDEVPGVYKDIEQVMDAQRDLVERIARFDPRLVKMAPAGERAED